MTNAVLNRLDEKRDSGSYEDIGRTFRIFQGLFFRGIK